MTRPIFIFLFLIGTGVLSVLPDTVTAQQNVEIKEADKVIGTRKNDKRVRKLIGNVHLLSGDIEMYSDSTLHYIESGILKSYGNIQINTPNERIWADSLHYNMKKELSKFRGRVIIKTNQTKLFGHKINYNFLTRVAYFLSPVRMKDERGLLKARQGFYIENQDSAIFQHQVQMSDTLKYIEGDSLHMNRSQGTYKMYGRVYVDDQKNKLELGGNYIKADSNRRKVKGNAYLQRFNQKDGQTDTTHIRARKINYIQSDTTNRVDAYGNVRIWSKQFSAVADSARYYKTTETFELWSNPRAWHQNIQLTGPYIEIRLDNQQVEKLISYPSPFAVQHDTTLNRFHQIKGDTLTALFIQGDLSQIHVRPNSQLLYYTKGENNQSDGAVRMSARTTRILFQGDTLQKVRANKSIDGTYIPESQNPAEKRLEGFKWTPDLRPVRPDTVLKRKWPKITGEPPFKLPQRYINFLSRQP